MPALDEISDLEHQIHNQTKVIEDCRQKIRQADEEIRRQTEAQNGAKQKLALHTGNIKHMKTVADHVDINEFAKTKQHLRDAKDSLAEIAAAIADAERRKKRYQETSDQAAAKVERARKELKQYGQLRQFPKRNAA